MKPNRSHTNVLHRVIVFAVLLPVLTASAYSQQTFQITSLTMSDSELVEHASVTGDDRGGIALSPTNLFYTGDDSTGSFATANLLNVFATGFRYDAIVSNIRTKQVYALGTAWGLVQNGGDLVSRLVPLDPVTGSQMPGDIQLSAPISITSGWSAAGIFSGWNRIVLLDGATLHGYNIDLPSGIVTPLGFINLPVDQGSSNDRCGCESWATWGVAEYSNGTINLVYAASPYFTKPVTVQPGSIRRYAVESGAISKVADFPAGIADMCSFTVDPVTDRWYFHYEGYAGTFDFGVDETTGSASASFVVPSSAFARIAGRVLYAKGRGLSGVVVSAVGADGTTTRSITNSFGFYSLPKLKVGQSYTVFVTSRRYYFPVSSELVFLEDDLIGLDFEAE